MKVKGFAWAGIATDDFEASLRFYTQVLGLEVETLADELAILAVGPRQQLELFGKDGPGKRLNAIPTIGFEVDDLDAACDALRAAGITLIGEPGAWNGYRWQYFRSPEGHVLEVKQLPAG